MRVGLAEIIGFRRIDIFSDRANPVVGTRSIALLRPGLQAVQCIPCVEQEPRMKTEHGHTLYMGQPARLIKLTEWPCDL